MARKPQPPAPAAPVRWTDEEWKALARHIAATKGTTESAALDVSKIKARDVFLAQDVLPEPRRRKLISIQQGFDASRNRLQFHLNAPHTPEVEGAEAVGRGADSPVERGRKKPDQNADKAQGKATGRNKAKLHGEAPVLAQGSTTESAADPGSSDGSNSVNSKEKELGDHKAELQTGDFPTRRKEAGPALAADSSISTGRSHAPAPAGHGRSDAGPTKSKRMTEEKRPGSPGPDLVELARPFVTMVCEELANAFVKALGADAAANTLKAAAGQDNGRRQPFAGEVGGGRPAASPKALEREALDLDDDQHHGETDLQPLFDPKLPPAANSPFRPRIALVAARADDLSDLQLRFPQLELLAVTLDELRSNPVLRTCQRIVGLREDVPAAADEYLRRSFGSRYFRANGGVGKVREQLQSWLNNPSIGSADDTRPLRQGGGKGAGAKKRQFRRPRA